MEKFDSQRFLTRLSQSSFRDKFVLKGGTLLAKYIPIGRETKDLDFFIQRLSNTEKDLENVLQAICDIDVNDNLIFLSKFGITSLFLRKQLLLCLIASIFLQSSKSP